MKPGDYIARFEFARPAQPGILQVDWQDGKTAHVLAYVRPDRAETKFELPFTVTDAQQLMEFRVQVDGKSPVVFLGVGLIHR